MEDYFSEECIRLVICFVNSQLVDKQPEQDLPSDPNAPLLEFVEGVGMRPMQRQGLRADPVHKLFFPDKQGNINIDLVVVYCFVDDQSRQICNALASVVAAILACPDQSTHLWYHLFSPDKLLGTQVTGFLVRLHSIIN